MVTLTRGKLFQPEHTKPKIRQYGIMSRPFHAKSRIVDSDYDSDATEDDVNQSILESQSSTNFEKVADDQEL